jgi:hypothetical protein
MQATGKLKKHKYKTGVKLQQTRQQAGQGNHNDTGKNEASQI